VNYFPAVVGGDLVSSVGFLTRTGVPGAGSGLTLDGLGGVCCFALSILESLYVCICEYNFKLSDDED